MAGFLTDNVISTAYTSLIFRKSDNKLYYDNGTADVEVLDLAGIGGTDADNDGRFEFESTDSDSVSSALTSGNLAQFSNNNDIKFSIDYNGVLKLKEQAGIPTAIEGGIYYKDNNLYVGID
tara:strand:- start:50 stop:412 length:363 start_codon:yes stop_codon:yes gene_type:complete